MVPRDNHNGDRVGLLFDTFDDQNTGYYFVVNAAGVQADYTVTADFRSWDKSWDGIWYSAARITNFGYCVEIQIPFRSIRYKSDLTEWGINFTRYIPIRDEQSYWTPQPRQGVRVSQSGRLFNIKPGVTGANLEIYPVALCRYEQTPLEITEAGKQGSPITMSSITTTKFLTGQGDKIRIRPDAGLDVGWSLGTASSFRLTTNPDFAQIEADPTQINLGKYELWLSERRPFFVEDAELFRPGVNIQTFYSRRIGRPLPTGEAVPIIAGAKFVAKLDRTDIGFLDVLCQKVNYEIDSVFYLEPLSYYRALRVRQSAIGGLKNSNLGFHYGTKINENFSNTAFGFDGVFQHKNLELKGQTTYAEFNSQSENRIDWAENFTINYEGERFNTFAQFCNIPENFDINGIGFVFYKGVDYNCNFGPNFYNLGAIRSLSINANLYGGREAGETVNGFGSGVYINTDYNNNWGNWLGIYYNRDYEMAVTYHKYSGEFGFWTDEAKPLYLTGRVWATNKEYNYRRDYFAPNGNFYLQLNWCVNPRFKTALNINNTTEWDTVGKIEAVSWILHPSINYALTRDLQLRIYSELDFDSKVHYLNLLLSWNFKPKSWVYLAFNESHDAAKSGFPLNERIAVVKIRYLFFF